jgi:hypothetical protein
MFHIKCQSFMFQLWPCIALNTKYHYYYKNCNDAIAEIKGSDDTDPTTKQNLPFFAHLDTRI